MEAVPHLKVPLSRVTSFYQVGKKTNWHQLKKKNINGMIRWQNVIKQPLRERKAGTTEHHKIVTQY